MVENSRRRSDWLPHLWAVAVPILAIVVGYVLWFAFMALFRIPDWLAAFWHRR